MNGVQPFVYLSTCGCVFSQAGLKAVAASGSPKEKEKDQEDGEKSLELCPQCGKKYSAAEDIIPLNPSTEEEETRRFALERKRLLEPPKKKSKKRKNDDTADDQPPAKKLAEQLKPSLNPSIAGASRAVVNELAKGDVKRKAAMSDAVKSLYGDGSKRKETFMTMGTFTRVSNHFMLLKRCR